jgi:predicted HD phosphohydrolase
MVAAASSVDEICALLDRYSRVETPLAGDIPAVLVTHGVQCAEILAAEQPADLELQVAGLLHDVGLLLAPGDELGHPRNGAAYVRDLLGDRVAKLIELHVDGQRYLEATEDGYTVAPPPTASFAEQPARMTDEEMRAFLAEPLCEAVLRLRRADDRAANAHRRGDDLTVWRGVMAGVAASS